MTTDKSRTNKKWTSNDDYKENYDRIFGKKEKSDGKSDQGVEVKKEESPKEEKKEG